jgi:hypothetical protein
LYSSEILKGCEKCIPRHYGILLKIKLGCHLAVDGFTEFLLLFHQTFSTREVIGILIFHNPEPVCYPSETIGFCIGRNGPVILKI